MNKTHWNTIDLGSNISSKLIKEWIDHSYDLVVNGLSKKEKAKLRKLKSWELTTKLK